MKRKILLLGLIVMLAQWSISQCIPTASCQNITTYLDGTGNVTVLPDEIDNGSTDNCGGTVGLDFLICDSVSDSPYYLNHSEKWQPFASDFNQSRYQVLYTAAEISSMGFSAGSKIYSIGFNVAEKNTTTPIPNFEVSIALVPVTTIGSPTNDFEVAAMNVIRPASDYSTVLGWNDFILPTIMVWDGTSSLLIQTCHSGGSNGAVNTDGVFLYNASGDQVVSGYAVSCTTLQGYYTHSNVAQLKLCATVSSHNYDCADVGTHDVTLFVTSSTALVTNSTSEMTTCAATVTIEDTISPTVIAQDITLYLDGTGNATITSTDIDNGSFDNCNLTMVLSQTTFNCGDTCTLGGGNCPTVQLTVTDSQGNSDMATATVTVLDTLSPTIVTQSVNAYLDASGNVTISTTDVENGSTDNCEIDFMTLSQTSFDCNDLCSGSGSGIEVNDQGFASSWSSLYTTDYAQIFQPGLNGLFTKVQLRIRNVSAGNLNVTVDILPGTDPSSTTVIASETIAIVPNDEDITEVVLTDQPMVLSGNDYIIRVTGLTVEADLRIRYRTNSYAFGNPFRWTGSVWQPFANRDMWFGTKVIEYNCPATTQLVVTDVSGNVDSLESAVLVWDTLVPTVNCQDITVALDNLGSATVTAADIDNGSSDNCSIDSMYLSSAHDTTFNCSHIGTNAVVLVVVDQSGNIDSCSAVVTITGSSTSTIAEVACDSYTSPSGIYTWTSTGSYLDTVPNAIGCDSVITINLTVTLSNTGIDTQTACDSYTWMDGNTYTSSNNTATHVLTNAAGCDSTVTLDLTINNSNTGTDTQTACDSYTWIDGNTYTSSNNTATFVETNAAGCDSTVTLDLTINYSNTGTDSQTACDSYTWMDGNTYTSSNNTATHVLPNAAGCDSTVTLDLTINNSNTGTDTQTACESFTWIDGNTYTSSNNTATFVETNAAGCDSTVTLDLTVNYDNIGTDTQTACDSYTWMDGNTYTSSNNTATHVLTNAAGCDSTVTLDLTINNSNTGIDTQTACDSYTWIDGNTYTSSNNTATFVETNAAGCDSTVTLDLTINYSNTGTDTQTACDSYSWIDGNTYTSSNNTATFLETNAAGCDSTVTLDLTINYSNTGTDTQTACESFIWIDGNTYTSSNNIATFVETNAAGCDSTVTLDLTINYSNTGTDTQTACDSYTWMDGNTYTSSNNTATYVLTNSVGCDSTVTLDLTINYTSTGIDTQIACDSYSWIDGNTYTSSNNTATFVETNAAGCDSTTTLDLTINYSNTGTDTQTACDSYIWIDGNIYTASNNTATFVETNAIGCDSIVTLDLTINTVDPSVTQAGIMLTANTAGGTYQWLDCTDNYAIMPGEINQSFTVAVNGDYAAEVTINGCSDTSACFSINSVGLYNLNLATSIAAYPNPTTGQLNIVLGQTYDHVKAIVMDVTGKVVSTGEFTETEKIEIVLAGPAGYYMLKVVVPSGETATLKVIKH